LLFGNRRARARGGDGRPPPTRQSRQGSLTKLRQATAHNHRPSSGESCSAKSLRLKHLAIRWRQNRQRRRGVRCLGPEPARRLRALETNVQSASDSPQVNRKKFPCSDKKFPCSVRKSPLLRERKFPVNSTSLRRDLARSRGPPRRRLSAAFAFRRLLAGRLNPCLFNALQ
jgi:hypothetical protein